MRRAVVLVTTLAAVLALAAPAHASREHVPLLLRLSDHSGPDTGGQQLTLTGNGLSHVTKVLFGATPAHRITTGDGRSVVVAVPKHLPAMVYVRVFTPYGGSSPRKGLNYSWTSTIPRPHTLSTPAGSTNGGDVITVGGEYLTHVQGVYFGGVPARILKNSDVGSVTVSTPGHVGGRVSVRVRTARGTTAPTQGVVFTYVDPPTMLAPVVGPFQAGDSAVVVHGAHFSPEAVVLIDDTPVRTGHDSSSELSGYVPADLPAGEHRVRVRTSFGTTSAETAGLIRTIPPWAKHLNRPLGNTDMEYVSCPAAGSCIVVTDQAYAHLDNTPWQPTPALARPLGVTCASATDCLALLADGSLLAFDGTSWRPATGAPGQVGAVTCVADGSCLAVAGVDRMTWTRGADGRWTSMTPLPPDYFYLQLSCRDATHCVASQIDRSVWVWDGRVWSSSTPPAPADGGRVVSACASSFCLAATDGGQVYTSTDMTSWQLRLDRYSSFSAVSCSAQLCVAVDWHGRAAVITPGDEKRNLVQPNNMAGLTILDVSCATDDYCVATGHDGAYVGPVS